MESTLSADQQLTELGALMCLEACYQLNYAAFFKQGVRIEREPFLHIPGTFLLTAEGSYQLWKLGVTGFAWRPMLQMPMPQRPSGILNGSH